MKTRIGKSIFGIFSTTLLIVSVVLLVEQSNGAFSGNYQLSALFPSAGTGLYPGALVTLRGVQIGHVGSIRLSGSRALVTLSINPNEKLPVNSVATITPQNIFGAEEVAISFTSHINPPFLNPGGRILHTQVSEEFQQLFQAAAPLLSKVNSTYLGNVITGLNQATINEAPRITLGIEQEAQFGELLSSTLDAQLSVLDSFTKLSQVLSQTGSYFNEIGSASNQFLPAFNQAADAYSKLINNFGAFSENLAQFLYSYHPDIVTLITKGDNVARIFLANESGVENLIHGLYTYVYKIANSTGPSAETLPNGSTFGYFKTFILFSDVNTLVCNLIAPPTPGLSALIPLQQAIESPGSPFNCSAQIASFNKAQMLPAPPNAPSIASPAINTAVENTLNQAIAILGSPENPTSSNLNSYLSMLIGQAP